MVKVASPGAFMLDQYRRDFAEFNSASAREHYLFQTGQKEALELAPIYERYSQLFDRSLVDQFKRKLAASSPDFDSEHASARRFFAFAVEQYLADSVKRLTEEIGQFEATATVAWGEGVMTFQEATVAIMKERVRKTRQEIYRRRLAVIEQSNGLRAERLLKLHDAARRLEYSSYADLFEQLRQLDYSALAANAATILSGTEATYVTRRNHQLRLALGIGVGEAQRSDAIYFLHLTSFDKLFPQDRMLQIYRGTMAGLGITVDAQKNISMDSEPRPRKNPRAFCVPISIPED